MEKNIIIRDRSSFGAKLKRIVADGADKLHVRMDFDGTITKAFVDGKKVPSIMAMLYNENYLDGDFSVKGKKLYNKYRPIEIGQDISETDKKAAMREWWQSIFGMMIQKKFSQRHIELIAKSKLIRLRGGFLEFAKMLDGFNVPLIVMSSSGLGVDAIRLILSGRGAMRGNIKIVSNRFVWDNNGVAISVIEPIVHTLDKDEKTICRLPEAAAAIDGRSNILLLTDTAADITMIRGATPGHFLTFGFLNEKTAELTKSFQKTFDAVLLNDAPLDFVNQILAQICGSQK